MATNRECLIIVLDVRRTADDTFKQKSFKAAGEILKDKIASEKKDYVSFVLIGAAETANHLNRDVNKDGYLHIKQYSTVQLATWQLLINFYKFVNEEPTEHGEWIDGLVVAMGMIKAHEEVFKIQRPRILLFYDFNDDSSNYDNYDVITQNIVKEEIDLVVVSHQIGYIDNPINGDAQAVFLDNIKSDQRLENEKYALRLVPNCNAKLCNFKEVLKCIFKVENKRPWTWNSTLKIGSKICIRICAIIVIKDESHISLKKCWAETDEEVKREARYYMRGLEVQPQEIDLLNGYMLGGTPIVYDEELNVEKLPVEPGLQFIGFVNQNTIPDEYFCGESLYWVTHQRNQTVSAKKMDALVKALHKTKRAMLCYKIYSAKFNAPKIVVLIPNKLHADKPASLSMIELSHHVQHHFWDFPALCIAKTECSTEQLAAIDDLIDAMDLIIPPKTADTTRDTQQKDLLPFDNLPHIFEQNVMDVLERKIICNASESDEQFQEMLKDKNFVEVFWKVPEPIEHNAKSAAKKVKQLFPLCPSRKWIDKLERKLELLTEEPDHISKTPLPPLDIEKVGSQTPADDFTRLVQHNVWPETNKTVRDLKFNYYSAQLRSVLLGMLRDESKMNAKVVAEGMRAYRKRVNEFSAFMDYNNWMRRVKTAVMDHNYRDFWEEVVVKEKLGLCTVGELTLEEKAKLYDFYILKVDLDSSESSQSTC